MQAFVWPDIARVVEPTNVKWAPIHALVDVIRLAEAHKGGYSVMSTNGVNGPVHTRPGEKERIPMTREGLEEKKARLQKLITEDRPQVADYIHEAKEAGDISESSAYEDAKNRQAMIEGEIQELQFIVDNAYIMEPVQSADGTRMVRLGTTVHVQTPRGERTVTLVNTVEANSADRNKLKVSDQSPIGRALMGRLEGDEVEIETPGGPQVYKILKIH